MVQPYARDLETIPAVLETHLYVFQLYGPALNASLLQYKIHELFYSLSVLFTWFLDIKQGTKSLGTLSF